MKIPHFANGDVNIRDYNTLFLTSNYLRPGKFGKISFFASISIFCGWGRDRTVDLTIFSRTLVPTELPSRYFYNRFRDPDGT